MHGRRLSSVAIALAVLIAAVLMIRAGTERPDMSRLGASPYNEAEQRTGAQRSATADAPPMAVAARDARRVFSGVVRELDRTPLAGAEVSFVVLPVGPMEVDDVSELALSEVVHTDSVGEFQIRRPDGELESRSGVVWVTARDHAAAHHRVEAPDAWGPQCELRLKPARDMAVAVVYADGTPVAGARIVHTGLEDVASGARPRWRPDGERSAFRRDYLTDAAGRARVPRLEGPQRIEAQLGDRRSRPFVGLPGESVQLVLWNTFTAHGSVRFESAAKHLDAVVVAESIRCGARVELARVVVRADCTWSASALPTCDGDEVVVRLEGSGIAPVERSLGRPAAGGSYKVDFAAASGVDAVVLVRGPSGEPVQAATVWSRWYSDGQFFEIERGVGTDGVAMIPVAEGVATYFGARADGLTASPIGPFTYSGPATSPVTLDLLHAGTIRGRCLHRNLPVSDFEVYYWRGSPVDRQVLRVSDAPDGAFLIKDAPLGEVTLCAQSGVYPPKEWRSVEVNSTAESDIELEIVDGRTGRGRIIDAASGEPLASARVQLVTNLPDGTPADRGPFYPVDAGGRFELPGFAPDAGVLWVIAPEHASRIAVTRAEDLFGFDFGVIPLARTQRLELRLVSASALDFSQAWARSYKSPLLPLRTFSNDGHVAWEDVPPRSVQIEVSSGEGLGQLLDLRLAPGKPWVFNVQANGGRKCNVRALVADRSARPSFLEAVLSMHGGLVSRFASFDQLGVASVGAVDGDEIALTIYAEDGNAIGSKITEIPKSTEFWVEVDCRRSGLLIRVIDGSSRPVAGARVVAGSVGSSLNSVFTYFTDSAGECTLSALDLERAWIRASIASLGVSSTTIVDLRRTPATPVLISLAGLHPIRIRLDDRGAACAGVDVRFFFEDGGWADGTQTDEAGRAITQPVGDGRYFVDVDDIGYWPIHHALPYPRTDAETVVQLRRLGGVRLEVRGVGGAVVPGTVIELRSIEFGTTVQQWIDEGRLAAPADGMLTDSGGALVVDGLPNGEYEWRAIAPDGSQATGTTLVPPRARGEQLIALGG